MVQLGVALLQIVVSRLIFIYIYIKCWACCSKAALRIHWYNFHKFLCGCFPGSAMLLLLIISVWQAKQTCSLTLHENLSENCSSAIVGCTWCLWIFVFLESYSIKQLPCLSLIQCRYSSTMSTYLLLAYVGCSWYWKKVRLSFQVICHACFIALQLRSKHSHFRLFFSFFGIHPVTLTHHRLSVLIM